VRFPLLALGWLLAVEVAAAAPPLSREQQEFFEQKIRPLLIERCLGCHSHGEKTKGNLVLDSRAGWQTGGDSGAAIVPGKPDESLLIRAVRYSDPDLKMPPAGKLKDSEIALLERWVEMGAPDPRDQPRGDPKPTGWDADAAARHWAYQPLQHVAAPPVQNSVWPLDELDRFVLAKLEERGWQPSADADRAVWLRRVTFDLTGLPPTTQEVTAFLADGAPDAHAAVVDRLLTSRAFGERWARAWLDLVGYADQIGSANNVPAEHAWRYRDYVIESFATDKPYDEFLREQLAGDLLSATSVSERQAQITATGFWVLGNINIVDSDKLSMRMDIVDRQIEKFGKTFLGMTLQCVRCHDHKFDPITMRDYYGLAGILASTEATYKDDRGVWSSVIKVPLPETLDEFTAREGARRTHEKRLAALQAERAALEQRLEAVQNQLPSAPEQADGPPAGTRTKAELEKERNDLQNQLNAWQNRYWHAAYLAPSAPVAFGVKDGPVIADARMQVRGNPHVLGESVPRGFVQVATHGGAPEISPHESGRRELAEWLTGPARPLVARTAVNRVWQKLFGRGLVSSTDYFGLRSEPPSHPELLDFLSQRFIDEGWSFRRLVRHIVLSRAYRQSSEAGDERRRLLAGDPENIWLWRMSPRRLEAEMLRDGVLAVSGLLQPSLGGPSLAPEFSENVGGLDPKDVNPISFSLRRFRDEQWRLRTIYLPVVRSSEQKGPSEALNFFDFTQPAQLTSQRATTAVASQALFLLNGPLFKDAARALAAELRADPLLANDADRLGALWLCVWNRPIQPDETVAALQFLAGEDPESAWRQLVQAVLISNEFLFRL
jgi:hypothetical protein